ncbi:N-acetylmuramidase family protein [Achromobacter sp. UMC71]|uniref:N-acetylmuramidase domain-containing protein n=1 Tax=Achromobacter sp. UMC71 TaxID=1862320 RepID=UPI001600E7CD|nr:N-acetylmuramidase family protein [Achromobacter sp. UMC71]MBB1625177.1 peptidoglycan-binding protein [Achromobacter sp. UMC71]
MAEILRIGARGQGVADLQTMLAAKGHAVPRTHVYDDATRQAVTAVQRAARLVEDGIYGPKTAAALAGLDLSRLLKEADLTRAAGLLGVSVATIKAVNEVEANGPGFLPDGRPVILFERHVFYRQLEQHGIDAAPLALRLPGIVNRTRGGYAGGAAEYRRLATATEISAPAALESASWGAFQVMGYHWQYLGYPSVDDFVACMRRSEGDHLEAFTRFVLADPALHKALAARKWAAFARGYNGPAYADNLYDVKLARAYERHTQENKVTA